MSVCLSICAAAVLCIVFPVPIDLSGSCYHEKVSVCLLVFAPIALVSSRIINR